MLCDNSRICSTPLLDLENNFQKVQKKVPFEAVVASAEVKLAVLILTHDAEAYSCDSRFRIISNISQLSKVK